MIERARVYDAPEDSQDTERNIIEEKKTLETETGLNTEKDKMERGKPIMNKNLITDWVRVHKTENIYDSCTPWWTPIYMKLTTLCNNKKTLPLRFTVMGFTSSGPPQVYGKVVTSLREIEMSNRELPLVCNRGKDAGTISFTSFIVNMKPSLVSFL